MPASERTPDTDTGNKPGSSDPDSTLLSATPLALTQLSGLSASDADRESDVSIKKRKRVRTGCFTCRDRHLKCDAAQGQCQNCLKSGRRCRRGVRLNFFDTQVSAPPVYLQPPVGKDVVFRDESRVIASEYVGGEEMYPPSEQVEDVARQAPTPVQSGSDLAYPLNRNSILDEQIAMSLIQKFATQLGPWLDVVDEMKHFTRILPLYAIEDPVLRAAFAAFAGCHTTRDHPDAASERLHPLSAAGDMLLAARKSLSDKFSLNTTPLCAVAGLILDAVGMLVLGSVVLGRDKHGEFALNASIYIIKDTGWTLLTPGLGGACFALRILIELVECITLNGTSAWNPDTWGIDLDFAVQPAVAGNEELWTRRIIYICAKISDLRSSFKDDFGRPVHVDETYHAQQWNLYNEWCDKWLASIPRSMLPLGHVQPWQRNPQSVFPQVWLLEKTAVIAHMLYHIARIMLIETDPLGHDGPGSQEEQERHAYLVCGIMSDQKMSGIPIIAVQLFGFSARYLIDRKAQEEAFEMLHQIRVSTGINTAHFKERLEEAWGWHLHPHQPFPTLDGTCMPMEFHSHSPGTEYPHPGINDPLSHSLEPGSYLHFHLTHDGP